MKILILLTLIQCISSCGTRTKVRDNTRIAQAALAGTFAVDSKKSVQVLIQGLVTLEALQKKTNYKNLKIQLEGPTRKILLVKDLNSSLNFSIDTDVDEGTYFVSLLDSQSSHVIDKKSIVVSKNSDRFDLTFRLK